MSFLFLVVETVDMRTATEMVKETGADGEVGQKVELNDEIAPQIRTGLFSAMPFLWHQSGVSRLGWAWGD